MSHLFQYVDCQILYHCVTSLEKNHFLKCCIFGESHHILVTRVLIFGSSPHLRENARQNFMQCILLEPDKVYGKNRSTHFQFSHSNSFILSRQVLCWPCFDRFSSHGRRSRRTRLLFPKRIGFDSLLFNCMLLSA